MFSWRRFIALSRHQLFSMKRNPARFIEILVWPTLEVFIFSLLSVSIVNTSSNELKIALGVLSGVVFWNFFGRVIQEAVAQFMDDALTKNMQNIFMTPLTLSEFLSSIVFISICKLLFSIGILSFVVFLLFPDFAVVAGNFAILWIFSLLVYAVVLSFFAIGILFIIGERGSFIGWFLSTAIQIFSCVFYERTVLPTGLREVSFLFPPSYVFESIRLYLSSGKLEISGILIANGISLLLMPLAILFVNQCFVYSRKSGMIIKI